MEEIRKAIIEKIDMARKLSPKEYLAPLPTVNEILDVPSWRNFEHNLWKIGEDIRQLYLKCPKLRKDKDIQAQLLSIACNRRTHRGRQSFIMLFASKAFIEHADSIAKQIDDPFVGGQVIYTLYRMKAKGYSDIISPFINNNKSWIRKEAKRYLIWEQGV